MLMNVLLRPWRSSLGAKYVMALTGISLLGFVIAHMLGNLLIYVGPDALNSYAHALKDKPALLWTARSGLLIIFLLHLVLAIRLTLQNQNARGVAYVYEDTVQASWASRHMLLTGLVLLAFIVFHLAHFTFGIITTTNSYSKGEHINYLDLRDPADPAAHSSAEGPRHDVYRMVVDGFRNWVITLTYVIAQVFLWLHLWHGASSWFQSLGLNHPAYNPLIRAFGPVVSTAILIGNCSIPLAVLSGLIGGSVP
jgi:succinate dehydrogenase / fumarate reductase, cytochrome b subunit